jgi:catechol 2,3-dioxygenase-like lactoylglutathione lyase family enzyme
VFRVRGRSRLSSLCDSGLVFDHVTIRVSDRAASERFYDTVLQTVGQEKTHTDERFAEWGDFSLAAERQEKPATRRLHVGFAAPTRDRVDEFWASGVAAGYRDDGAPGPRPEYSNDYYGAFVLDPDGNSAEAVHHGSVGERGLIDHVWMRVADVGAARRFYDTVAPYTGFRLVRERPDRAHFRGRAGGFTVIQGSPTTNAHIAFPATTNETVDEFHRASTEAGFPDNGPPGERPIYHPGYYAAFVLDPDGNNVEVVCHNR